MNSPLRKTFEAVVWHRGPISGPLTAPSLSALLTSAAQAPQACDLRCEIRCADGFSLRLSGVGDEGFESDDEPAVGADDRLQEEIRISDHAVRAKSSLTEEDSSSANSSCSDTDDPNGDPAPRPTAGHVQSHVVHGSDILFCHTDPAAPRGVVFVTRQPRPARMDDALEVIVLRCARETVAKDLYTTYHEVTRRLKWERYTNAKHKSDVIRASFRNVNDSLRLRPAGRLEELPAARPHPRQLHERDPQPRSLTALPELADRLDGLRPDSGPSSLPQACDVSRILSLSTPEDGWATSDATQMAHRRRDGDDEDRGRARDRPAGPAPARYSHNKGPAPPAPAPRKHPTNPNLLLVPTKNGLEPYRVVTSEAPRPVLLYAAEFPARGARPDWPGHKMSQFDANNNRSRPPVRQQLYWLSSVEAPGRSGGRKPELRPRARSKSPGGRHRGFELPGALSQALRGLTSHLKRPPAEAPPPPAAPVNPKSMMKKRDKIAGSPETKRVTFSAYSTVQVMH